MTSRRNTFSSTRLAAIGVVAGFATLAGTAHAQAQGFSVGGNLGSSHWKGDAVGGLTTDSSSRGGKVYGGYSFSPNFGVEAGYARFGRYRSAAGTVQGDGYFLDGVGTVPLGNGFSALGRVGVFSGRLDSSLDGSDRGTSWKMGAGLQYDINPKLAVRGEWERYRFDTLGATPKTDMYSVGVNYRF